MFDLGGPLSDLEGKNSKFRRITFLRMVTKNISMRFQHSPIKTVGGVRKYEKVPKNYKFLARGGKTENRSTAKPIPGSYFYPNTSFGEVSR